ncbi:MAG: patatin-like phospholipase family protein [Acinetobacter sp.]
MFNFARWSIVSLIAIGLYGCSTTGTQHNTTPSQAREPVIAIALGGGGAKGFAHIGVLKVLEAHGIKAKIVTGTSSGSFVGSLYASGKTPVQLQQLAAQLKESDIRDLTISRQGFVVGQKLQDYINREIGNKSIQQFPIRFAAVATRLDNGQKVNFTRGNAGQAVRASCSIPNVFIPAKIGGVQYVDGGLVSPIPVKTAKSMGADIVIAVDISARPAGTSASSLLGLLDQTINIMGQQAINDELSHANVVIQPKVEKIGPMDLRSGQVAILEGEQAAQQKIKAIQTAIYNFKQSPAALLPPPRPAF